MKKIIIPILLIFVLIALSACSSNKPTAPHSDITGTWEKMEGVNKGLQVKIEKQGEGLKSSVVKVNKKTDVANYVNGDEKWTEITKVNDTEYTMKDLAPIMNNKTVRYNTKVKFANNGNNLEVNPLNNKGEEVGSTEVWARVN